LRHGSSNCTCVPGLAEVRAASPLFLTTYWSESTLSLSGPQDTGHPYFAFSHSLPLSVSLSLFLSLSLSCARVRARTAFPLLSRARETESCLSLPALVFHTFARSLSLPLSCYLSRSSQTLITDRRVRNLSPATPNAGLAKPRRASRSLPRRTLPNGGSRARNLSPATANAGRAISTRAVSISTRAVVPD